MEDLVKSHCMKDNTECVINCSESGRFNPSCGFADRTNCMTLGGGQLSGENE